MGCFLLKDFDEFNDKVEELFGFKSKNGYRSKNKKVNEALKLLDKGINQVKVDNIKPTAIPSLRRLERRGFNIYYDSHKKTLIIEKGRDNKLF